MITIDKAIVIHPDIYTERLKNFEAVYPSCLPRYEIPPALTGKDVSPPEWWLASKNAYALLENVKNVVSGLDSVTIVFEDDCRFSSEFESLLPKFLAEVPDDWDLAYLDVYHLYTRLHKPIRVSKYCLKDVYIVGTPAVIYNPNSKDKLLDILNENNWKADYTRSHEYDHAYAHAAMRHKINVYSPIKNICGQHTEPSTLRNNPGVANPTFYNNFEYVDLDRKVKRMTDTTVID